MKFLVDSCISKFAVDALRKAGYETLWLPETGEDPGDEVIIQKAFEEDYVLVTADKDFGELIFLKRKASPAVIRLVNIRAKEQGKILIYVVEKYRSDIQRKALITVERFRVRIRSMEGDRDLL